MPKQKFYAVRKGRHTGIFNSWDECKSLVTGYKDAKFQSFSTIAEAQRFLQPMRSITSSSPKIMKSLSSDSEFGALKVFTDGSCMGNGTAKAKAGIGIYFGPNDNRNLSEPLEGVATNNRAELMALIRALEIIGPEKAVVYTDSTYSIKGITQWIKRWKLNGWKTSTGTSVINQDLWIRFDKVYKSEFVDIQYIKAHVGHHGNEMADMLARQGALQYQ